MILINYSLRTTAVGNGSAWLPLLDTLLTTYLPSHPPLPNCITPLLNLLKAANSLPPNREFLINTCTLLSKWWFKITSILDRSFKRHEFTLCSVVLNFNIEIVQLIKKYPDVKPQIQYDPSSMT